MNQEYYKHIRQIHQQQLETSVAQMELKKASKEIPTLRQRSQLYLSDALLSLGQRIRPAEFRVKVQSGQAQDGRLEINAGGC